MCLLVNIPKTAQFREARAYYSAERYLDSTPPVHLKLWKVFKPTNLGDNKLLTQYQNVIVDTKSRRVVRPKKAPLFPQGWKDGLSTLARLLVGKIDLGPGLLHAFTQETAPVPGHTVLSIYTYPAMIAALGGYIGEQDHHAALTGYWFQAAKTRQGRKVVIMTVDEFMATYAPKE